MRVNEWHFLFLSDVFLEASHGDCCVTLVRLLEPCCMREAAGFAVPVLVSFGNIMQSESFIVLEGTELHL